MLEYKEWRGDSGSCARNGQACIVVVQIASNKKPPCVIAQFSQAAKC